MVSDHIQGLMQYSLLGRSGLRVSPLCLGTMTFGNRGGWGCDQETAYQLLDYFFASGGNFIDTADGYSGGDSESILGQYFKQRNTRQRAVIATKFTFNKSPGDPNAGGNARKNVYRALDESLRRLQTDYIDLYWLHAWDGLTPVEEVITTMNDLVRSGKIRYIGLSDVPAWYLARAQTIAEWRGLERVCAVQLEYSLLERNIEREHIPAAIELGVGVCPWSPLGSGMLTGKYLHSHATTEGEGRLRLVQNSGNPAFDKLFTEKNWSIAKALTFVASEMDKSPAQVAINWITKRPGVVSTIIGATKIEQLETNIRALDFEIPTELWNRLDEISKPELVHPYYFFEHQMRAMITGGTIVRQHPSWHTSLSR